MELCLLYCWRYFLSFRTSLTSGYSVLIVLISNRSLLKQSVLHVFVMIPVSTLKRWITLRIFYPTPYAHYVHNFHSSREDIRKTPIWSITGFYHVRPSVKLIPKDCFIFSLICVHYFFSAIKSKYLWNIVNSSKLTIREHHKITFFLYNTLFLTIILCPADNQYSVSQGLILTISLNNYARSDPRFDYVMLWEKEFLNVLKEYQQDPKSNLILAYMAEVSGAITWPFTRSFGPIRIFCISSRSRPPCGLYLTVFLLCFFLISTFHAV